MSTIRTNAILDSAGGNTATINGIPLRQGILDPENRIINGAFDFWQRGTSFTTSVYGADRWINAVVGGTVTMSRVVAATGLTFGSNNPAFFLNQAVSGQTLVSQYSLVEQRIEGVRSYAGQTITILGWARRFSGSGNMAVELFQDFGTGGSFSPITTSGGAIVPLTGSFAPFAVTIPVQSISGKTIGTNGNDYLSLRFWTSAGANYASQAASLGLQTIGVDLWGIHIKLGTHTTAAVDLYKQPELQPELARCQRYYVSYGGSALFERIGMGQAISATSAQTAVALPVEMRIAPALTASGALGVANNNGTTLPTTGNTIGNPSSKVATVVSTVASGLVAGDATQLLTNNSLASRLAFDAEL